MKEKGDMVQAADGLTFVCILIPESLYDCPATGGGPQPHSR